MSQHWFIASQSGVCSQYTTKTAPDGITNNSLITNFNDYFCNSYFICLFGHIQHCWELLFLLDHHLQVLDSPFFSFLQDLWSSLQFPSESTQMVVSSWCHHNDLNDTSHIILQWLVSLWRDWPWSISINAWDIKLEAPTWSSLDLGFWARNKAIDASRKDWRDSQHSIGRGVWKIGVLLISSFSIWKTYLANRGTFGHVSSRAQ